MTSSGNFNVLVASSVCCNCCITIVVGLCAMAFMPYTVWKVQSADNFADVVATPTQYCSQILESGDSGYYCVDYDASVQEANDLQGSKNSLQQSDWDEVGDKASSLEGATVAATVFMALYVIVGFASGAARVTLRSDSIAKKIIAAVFLGMNAVGGLCIFISMGAAASFTSKWYDVYSSLQYRTHYSEIDYTKHSAGYILLVIAIISWFIQAPCTLGQFFLRVEPAVATGGTTVIVQHGAPGYHQMPGGAAVYMPPPQPGTYVAGGPVAHAAAPYPAGKVAYPTSTV
eukprot:CAMPEP_0196778864 /NCGR_PEP_ID=MMETSP1104-20130614/6044_1 /TAXON_ID=33652 /ORGANISM="Cafeteria sp., Strain Caron Lab Isolate" /LENGTH=286 /DNA_ID=CAMNT_0042149037 /DNA_START=58 /DNA_END=918 /DNA_ORIENTATION=+